MTKEEFKSVYDQYFDPIRNYIYYRSGKTDLATDIAQEAFIKIWEKQLSLSSEEMKRLLYKIAGDLFISYIRREKVALAYTNEIKFQRDEVSEESDVNDERMMRYQRAIAQLPEKQRTVLLMNKIDGITYKGIAERLNVSVKAVEKRMSTALKWLREEVKK